MFANVFVDMYVYRYVSIPSMAMGEFISYPLILVPVLVLQSTWRHLHLHGS